LRFAVLCRREIAQREKLLVVTPERLRARFNLVRVRDLVSGYKYEGTYDKLILAPGAAPLRPPIPASSCLESSRYEISKT
jgi:hypothetical protein